MFIFPKFVELKINLFSNIAQSVLIDYKMSIFLSLSISVSCIYTLQYIYISSYLRISLNIFVCICTYYRWVCSFLSFKISCYVFPTASIFLSIYKYDCLFVYISVYLSIYISKLTPCSEEMPLALDKSAP